MLALLDSLLTLVFAGGVIALLLELPFGFLLWRETRKIPDPPLSVRLNPFNILGHRDLWTAEVESVNKRMVQVGLAWLGLTLVGAVILLIRWTVQQR